MTSHVIGAEEATVPAVIQREGSEWCVYSHKGGKKLGCHDTKQKARDQQKAVNASLARRGEFRFKDQE
jgi:hypothetical protein